MIEQPIRIFAANDREIVIELAVAGEVFTCQARYEFLAQIRKVEGDDGVGYQRAIVRNAAWAVLAPKYSLAEVQIDIHLRILRIGKEIHMRDRNHHRRNFIINWHDRVAN